MKRYICSIALYGAETLTLLKVDQKCLGSFEMWYWRKMEKVSWSYHVRNEEELQRVKEDSNILLKKARPTSLVRSCVGTALLKEK